MWQECRGYVKHSSGGWKVIFISFILDLQSCDIMSFQRCWIDKDPSGVLFLREIVA